MEALTHSINAALAELKTAIYHAEKFDLRYDQKAKLIAATGELESIKRFLTVKA